MTVEQERRRAVRHRVCCVAYLRSRGGRPRTAVFRDASDSGAFLLTRVELSVGEPIEIEMSTEEDRRHHVTGRVVRTKPWDNGGPWTQGIGVAFDGVLGPEVGLEALAERQARWV